MGQPNRDDEKSGDDGATDCGMRSGCAWPASLPRPSWIGCRSCTSELLASCRAKPEEAAKLVGGSEAGKTSTPEAAAWVALARALLNLDEFVTRE